MSPERLTRHVTDEELLLDFYNEDSSTDRARVQGHLERCDQCRALDRDLRAVLTAVETTPLDEPPSGFEREMWARIEPLLPVGGARVRWTGILPRLAISGGMAALVIAAFTAGRVWDTSPAEPSDVIADEQAVTERLLRAEVGDHLERSQRVLVELVNADLVTGDPIEDDRARAADLVAAGRLYRQSAENLGDSEMGGLLEDLERVLVEVANGPADAGPEDLIRLRQRIDEQDLVFRLRVVAGEMRERERRAHAEW